MLVFIIVVTFSWLVLFIYASRLLDRKLKTNKSIKFRISPAACASWLNHDKNERLQLEFIRKNCPLFFYAVRIFEIWFAIVLLCAIGIAIV